MNHVRVMRDGNRYVVVCVYNRMNKSQPLELASAIRLKNEVNHRLKSEPNKVFITY
jgi:hypothetical protein